MEDFDTIVLFTESYPYDFAAENTFLDPEIRYLENFCQKIIILPRLTKGHIRNVSKKVSLDFSLATYLQSNRFSQIPFALSHKDIYVELIKNISNFDYDYRSILYAGSFYKNSVLVKKWLPLFIGDNDLDLKRTIFYTYWLNDITLGIGLAKDMYRDIYLISRAHGADLYEERHDHCYVPFFLKNLRSLDQLYLISEHGRRYITQKYPILSKKCKLARLGVPDPKFTSCTSDDEVFRIVSCSFIVPVKRIDLLIDGLAELGKSMPEKKFEWVHIGGGPLEQNIKQIALAKIPKNINFKFTGHISNDKVISFYQNNKVDIFINVSESEGLPVSIMEVQSCGIPVIATSVGGVPEIVSDSVGLLIDLNPTPRDISNAICELINDRQKVIMRKEESKKNWAEKFNADKNFHLFATELRNGFRNRSRN